MEGYSLALQLQPVQIVLLEVQVLRLHVRLHVVVVEFHVHLLAVRVLFGSSLLLGLVAHAGS
jgi:hypothetical protein